MKKRFIPIFLLLVVLFTLTGCGGKKDQEVITFMYWNDTVKEMQQFDNWIAEFTEETGIKVQTRPTPIGAYETKLAVLMGSADAPDLFVLSGERLASFIENDALLSLNPYFFAENMTFPDPDLYPEVYGPDGLVYGIPGDPLRTYVIFNETQYPEEVWKLLNFLRKKLNPF